MLGFERDGAWAMGQAFYGEGSGTIWLDNLSCDGTEISLKECSRKSLGEHDCSHSEDAGIVCKPLKIRLTGGETPYEGRIEVFHSENWGTVCDSNFGTIQAQVLCHVLGYQREGAVAYGNAYFGQGSGSVWLSNIDCEVQDPYFLNCRNISLLPSNCDHTKDAGIRCTSNTRVRLVGGPSAYEGRVEVFFFNTWGTVCDDSFDTYDAQVFCHMLGYSRNGAQAVTRAIYGKGSGVILLDDLSCDGTEVSVNDCSGKPWGKHDCRHLEDAGIVCKPLVNEGPTILPIRLVTNITEDAPVGTVVGEFTVHDPDDDERGEIIVYSNDKPKELTIGPIVNERVQLVLEGKLDADKYRDDVKHGNVGPVLNFTVMVKDKPGLVASVNVSLMIIDVNDNSPICNPSGVTVKIPRDSQISTNIFILDTACRDKDYFYKDAIYIMEDDTCSAFGLHTSGELYVNGEILSVFSSCMVTVNVTDVNNALYSTKLDVTIEFFECPSDVDHLHTIWQRGIPGRLMFGQCPMGYTGKVTRFCDTDGVYHDPVYNCTKRKIAEIFEKVHALNENTSASDVLEELANVTTIAHANMSLLVGDLEAVNTILSKVTKIIEVKPENIERIADSFIETANNILDESTTTSWTSKMNQTGSGADIVLENLDNFVEKISNVNTTTGKLKVKKSNLYLAVETTGDCEGNGIQFPKRTDGDVPEWAEKTLDGVQMPCDKSMSFKSYSSVLYRNLSKIIPSTFVNKSTNDRQLNGPVMSFTYFPKPEQDLASPIELTFQLYNSSLEKPVCSFWSRSDRLTGAWSSAGCWLDRFTSDKKTVVCKCNHLTNFAVLMSPSPLVSPDHNVALSTISMIGCILSMICLASSIGIYGFFWRTVKSEKSIMNVNLCCVLFVAYLVFLVGVNKTENKSICTAVAVSLHLVYLIVFFIMLSEGLMLTNTVLYPFSTRKPCVPLLIASYVMAILIVAISMAAVKLEGYGGEKSCWLSTSSGLVWAFLAPVLLIIAINIIITTLVIKKLFTTAAMSKKTDKEKAKLYSRGRKDESCIRAGVRSIIILMPIMGVTWILGVFSVSDGTVVFQYLFALFNSVQGVLIFVFHCVINRKVQEALRKKMSRWQSLRSYDISKSFAHSSKSTRVTESTSAM